MAESINTLSLLHICLWLCLTFLLAAASAALTQLLARRFARVHPEDHWAVHARKRFPITRIQLFNFIFLMIFTPFFFQKLVGRNLLVSDLGMGLMSVVSTYGGLRFINYIFARKQPEKKRALSSLVTMFIVVAFPLPIFLLFGITMPNVWGTIGAVWILSLISVNYLFIRGLGIWIARRFGLVIAPTQELQSIVADLNAKINIPNLKVWIARSDAPNAFAFPWIKTIICSDALMNALEPNEIRAICAHELGHLTEGSGVVRRRLAGIWLSALILIAVYLFRIFDIEPWVSAVLAWAAALTIIFSRRKFGRTQEERADKVAHDHSDAAYARGLEKIYRINGIPAVMGSRQIHPSLYDRMLAAGVTPDFPRPERPSIKLALVGMMLNVLLIIGLALGWLATNRLLTNSGEKTQRSLQLKMVLEGSSPMDLATIGWSAIDEEQYSVADIWFNQAIAFAPTDYKVLTSVAYGYSRMGDCQKSQNFMVTAEHLLETTRAKEPATDINWYKEVGEYVKLCDHEDL